MEAANCFFLSSFFLLLAARRVVGPTLEIQTLSAALLVYVWRARSLPARAGVSVRRDDISAIDVERLVSC